MQGLMQHGALTLDKIIDHAAKWHGDREVVSRSVEGPIVRTTYGQIRDRAKRVSNLLLALGIKPSDRVGTLAWNTGRHMEAWYGIMGMGAVCHTLNPRLFPEQIAWIADHAGDRVIFTDLTFLPIIAAILPRTPKVEHVVVFTDRDHMPADFAPAGEAPHFKGLLCYEDMVEQHGADCAWGGFDEGTAAGLCYTSGTTGDPKGVLYSHRSNFLHTLITLQPDVMGLSQKDVILPVVPMFHANAWGVAFSAPGTGAKMVMPGAKMDGASIFELLDTEGVTFSAAVPTVWQMLLQHLEATGAKLPVLKKVVIGGAACPESIIRAFHEKYDVEVVHAWGMTETSPVGTLSVMTDELSRLPYDQQMPYRLKQGRPPLGVEICLRDDEGGPLPHDGKAFGHLKIRGPIIAAEYFRGAGGRILDDEGFFDTGDVATIDDHGFMQITDRAKDVIKSGGEWISTIEIENIAVGHPKAALAAVVGAAHPKWDERPVLLVKLKDGETATKEEFLDYLQGKIAKWWMPDDVLIVDDIPLGATGKIDKKVIRQRLVESGYVLPTIAAVAAPVVAPVVAPTLAAADGSHASVIYAPEPPREVEPKTALGEPQPVAETLVPATDEAVAETVPDVSEAVETEAPPTPAEVGAAPILAGFTTLAGAIGVVTAASAHEAPSEVVEADAQAATVANGGVAGEAEPQSIVTAEEATPPAPEAVVEAVEAEAQAATVANEVVAAELEPAPIVTAEEPAALVAEPEAPAPEAAPVEPSPEAMVAEVLAKLQLEPAAAGETEVEAEPAPQPEALEPEAAPAAAEPQPEAPPSLAEPSEPVTPAAEVLPFAAPISPVRKAKDRKAISWPRLYLDVALLLALTPAILAVGGALGVKLGAIGRPLGYSAMTLDWAPKVAFLSVATGIVGFIVARIGGFSRLWRAAVLALAVTALTLAVMAGARTLGGLTPPIHDVATDWETPLMLSDATLAARGGSAEAVLDDPALPVGSAAYAGRRIADINAETCPAAKPLILAKPTSDAYHAVKAAVLGSGMTLVTDSPMEGVLEATGSTFWYGLTDDMAVRIRPDAEGSRIDMRSISRDPGPDQGRNCDRIGKLLAAVKGR